MLNFEDALSVVAGQHAPSSGDSSICNQVARSLSLCKHSFCFRCQDLMVIYLLYSPTFHIYPSLDQRICYLDSLSKIQIDWWLVMHQLQLLHLKSGPGFFPEIMKRNGQNNELQMKETICTNLAWNQNQMKFQSSLIK